MGGVDSVLAAQETRPISSFRLEKGPLLLFLPRPQNKKRPCRFPLSSVAQLRVPRPSSPSSQTTFKLLSPQMKNTEAVWRSESPAKRAETGPRRTSSLSQHWAGPPLDRTKLTDRFRDIRADWKAARWPRPETSKSSNIKHRFIPSDPPTL
ncbi:hypothetical protein GWK47_020999 [Chionoecetes opilio]|uniref:Uncharacterized protein n=1 Tax=Chionoecetes opilio TaxID=41210 RepID=A0A8J4XNU8_CHIOP|nr:hypothetical protein GWK47_020999 [Chionoecetes opilio]